MIYDRIDLKAIGTWAKNFRPTGLILSFGTNLTGGNVSENLLNTTVPYGCYYGDTKLTIANNCGGIAVSGQLVFETIPTLTIPYGIVFSQDLIIGGIPYPKGTFNVPSDSQFIMKIVQVVDVNNSLIANVGDVKTDEVITFKRPTADIKRLIMYKEGVGIDTDTFACYNIVFKATVTVGDVNNFNKLHPPGTTPLAVIVESGYTSPIKSIVSV